MLIQVEYKTRNIQKSISSGGLGVGATVYPDYNSYEAYFKPQRGISCIPCGVTNSLGNKSGEVYFLMKNVPVASTGSGETIEYKRFADVWMPCMSYRGIEHYFGHIYKITDQINVKASPTGDYIEGHEGDSYYIINEVSYFYQSNPYLVDNKENEKNKLGTYTIATNIMCVSSLMMGENGHVLHVKTDGKDWNTNYCDCCEISVSNPTKLKYITFNGRIVSSNLVGNHFLVAYDYADGSSTRPSDGTRIDHF